MSSLADRLLQLLEGLDAGRLDVPDGVDVLDPFHGPDAGEVQRIVRTFHTKYYADDRPRLLMLGINPGRLGAGSTGLPFTDTKRCEADLGIPVEGFRTHEPSSDFFYRVVRAAGGAGAFYCRVYVHAICPFGFTRIGPTGRPVNLNYYDDKDLQGGITPFVHRWLKALVATGMRTDRVFCVGTGKNLAYLEKLNAKLGLFGNIVPLEHPRYVMQYKARMLDHYVDKYLDAIGGD